VKLAIFLQDLVDLVTSTCDTWKKEEKIRKEKRDYIRYEVKEFEYEKKRFSWSHKVVTKEEWDSWDIYKLVDSLKNAPQFRKCVTAISEIYGVSEDQAESWLFQFVYKIVYEFLTDNLDSKAITSLIVTFVNELEGNPVEWNITVWLSGVHMGTDQIELEKGILIRRPRPKDIEYEVSPLSIVSRLFVTPSAILEIHKRIKFKPPIYPELEKILLSLRLYKLGSVGVKQIKWEPNSILGRSSVSYPPHWTITYKYSLTEDDKESLPNFVKEIKDKLPVEEKTGRPLSSHPIGIAILRYQDAISKPETIENKIAYAIMGLEALYLKAEERQELSHRLAQRVAKVMKFFDKQPIKVYNIIKDGYEIRSSFVHGSPSCIEEPRKAKEILDKIVEYLRKSIIVFLQIPKEKEDFISLIDNSMLENRANEKLQQLIGGGLITSS